MKEAKFYSGIEDKVGLKLNQAQDATEKGEPANSKTHEVISSNVPEIFSTSTDAIRKTEEYSQKVSEVIDGLGINADEFARYPGAYIFPEQLKDIANKSNEAKRLNELFSKDQVISADKNKRPLVVNIGGQDATIEWGEDDRIISISYKGFDRSDIKITIPRGREGKIILSELGEPFSGRDVSYRILAEQIAKNIRSQELEENESKKIVLGEFFLKNRVELAGFFNRLFKEKEKACVETDRRTTIIALKAFDAPDKSSQINQRMGYRKKYGSQSEATDANLVEKLNSQYELTEEDMLSMEGSESVDDVIFIDNTTTINLEDNSNLSEIENSIREKLEANKEIQQLLKQFQKCGIDIFVTGPVASGKSLVAKILKKMITEEK